MAAIEATNVILRRRNLGRTSCREIIKNSKENLQWCRTWKDPIPKNINFLFRWGCTAQADARVTVNTSRAIARAADKYQARVAWGEAGVSIPDTWDPLTEVPQVDYPNGIILRNHFHHQGKRLIYAKNQDEYLRGVANLAALGSVYASEYIPKKEEFRIYVVQGRVAMVARKEPGRAGDVAWNHHLGGHFSNVRWKDWPIPACLEAIKASRVLGLDFSGIDTIQEKAHLPIVLEANAAPSMTSAYRQQTFAKCFDYMIAHGKGEIPLKKPKKATIYSHLIHPAIAKEARLEDE